MLVQARWILAIAFTTQVLTISTAAPTEGGSSFDLLMPEVQPQKADTYLCRSVDVNEFNPYIVGFVPNANKEIAHHILLYGCTEPGSDAEVWNCGEMNSEGSDYESGPVCKSGSQIIYAWAMDAPSLSLPKDVAFKVGGDTGISKLALQVHYKNVSTFLPPQNKTDSSGLTLITTTQPKSRRAGVYLMVTGGNIPAKTTEYLEAACYFPDDDVVAHPFAYRTHAHGLGRVISGYRVRDGVWEELGRRNPGTPQMFYNTTKPGLSTQKGDILAARCTMENELNHDVAIGRTQKDEMCNFYIMYYVEGDKLLSTNTCFKAGAPYWYLEDFQNQEELNLADMPPTASENPDTKKTYVANSPSYLEMMEETAGEVDVPGQQGSPSLRALNLDNAAVSDQDDEILDQFLNQMNPREAETLIEQLGIMDNSGRNFNVDENRNSRRYIPRQDIDFY